MTWLLHGSVNSLSGACIGICDVFGGFDFVYARLYQEYIWKIFDDGNDDDAIGVNAEHKPSATRRQETSTNHESGRT